MIEQRTSTRYYCDDCGGEIFTKTEPFSYELKETRMGIMLCSDCIEKLIKILKKL